MGKFIPVLLFLLLCACSASVPRGSSVSGVAVAKSIDGQRPSWVDGSTNEYPRGRYLVGIGVADDQAAAMERARGEISKVFRAQITANTLVTASEQSSQRSGSSSSSSSQDVIQTVRSMSQKVLEGVEIVRGWKDPATRQYYSLAVLERGKALSAMKEKLDELDGRAMNLKTRLASAQDKLEKIKCAFKLLSLLKAREGVVADMRVLSPGAAAASLLNPAEAAESAAKALSQLNVAVSMPGEEAGRLRSAVVSALNSFGIDAGTSAAADIVVECSAQFASPSDPDPNSSWKWSRATATVSMKDVKTGKVFMSFEASAREASSSAEEARGKAEYSLGKKVAAEISRGIDSYLAGE